LQRQIRELEESLEVLKEEIFQYAQQFTMTKIYGSSRHINVSIKETFRAPSNDVKLEKETRRLLEEYLKTASFGIRCRK